MIFIFFGKQSISLPCAEGLIADFTFLLLFCFSACGNSPCLFILFLFSLFLIFSNVVLLYYCYHFFAASCCCIFPPFVCAVFFTFCVLQVFSDSARKGKTKKGMTCQFFQLLTSFLFFTSYFTDSRCPFHASFHFPEAMGEDAKKMPPPTPSQCKL